jgi:hypothetical protein
MDRKEHVVVTAPAPPNAAGKSFFSCQNNSSEKMIAQLKAKTFQKKCEFETN